MKNKFLISSIGGLMIISAFLLVLVVNGNKPLESAPESSGEESHMSVEDNKNENDKDIYGTVGIENSWYADPADPNNLITNESYVVKVEIISIGEAKMLPKTEHFDDSKQPYTPVEVEIIKTISGNELSGTVTVYLSGGDIKISDLIKSLDEALVKKMELNTLSQEEQNKKYISYKTTYDYKLKTGNQYVVILNKQADEIYAIVANGYGIFQADQALLKEKKQEIFKNVLTDKELI